MSDDIAELRARLERLEARSACQSVFHEYLHYVDGGFTDDLLQLFTEDARVEVMNFPPGSGENLEYHGREQFRPLYAGFAGSGSRHHSANATIDVDADATHAELSSYFLTAVSYGLTGGIYEASLEPRDGRWQLSWLRISSTWGWALPQEMPPYLAEPLGAGTLREGRPVLYGPGPETKR